MNIQKTKEKLFSYQKRNLSFDYLNKDMSQSIIDNYQKVMNQIKNTTIDEPYIRAWYLNTMPPENFDELRETIKNNGKLTYRTENYGEEKM